MSENIKHKESEKKGMFFIEDNEGVMSQLTYTKRENGVLIIDETETREELQGKGLASKLVKKIVKYAREKDFKIDPLCPFAEAQFEENEEYQEVRVS